MQPEVSASPAQTHACLVTSTATFESITASVSLTTLAQLRAGSAPNPWEVAWLIWAYTSDTAFYSLNLKPNGWELGKEDASYPGAQRFLATAATPAFPIGKPYAVRVTQTGATMTVNVNGTELVSYTDTENPYLSGSVGLYCEDSHVQFAPVTVNGAVIPW